MATNSVGADARPRPFYGWWIVIGSFLIMATCYAVFVNTGSLFQRYVVADLGITVSQYNLGVTIGSLTGIIGSLLIGPLIDRCSARIVTTGVVAVAGLVLFLYSTMDALWKLYVYRFIAGFIIVAGTRLLVSVLITNWFKKKQGLALAIALAGSGLGGALLSPVITALIGSSGWRFAYMVLGAMCVVLTLPIVLPFFASKPSDRGLEPYGGADYVEIKADTTEEATAEEHLLEGIGWKQLRRSAPFWVMVLGFVAMGLVNGCILTNQVSNMTSITVNGTEIVTGGHSPEWASVVLSANLVTVVFAKLVTGWLYDRFGIKAATLVGTAACVIACIGLCFPATDIGPYVGGIAFGFGTCMGTIAPPVVVSRAFGKQDLGKVNGIVVGFQLLGGAVGTVLSGVVFDAFLSFAPVRIFCIVSSMVMGACILGSTAWAHRRRMKELAA